MRRFLPLGLVASVLAGCATAPGPQPWGYEPTMDREFYDALVASYIAQKGAEDCPGLAVDAARIGAVARDLATAPGRDLAAIEAVAVYQSRFAENSDVIAFFESAGADLCGALEDERAADTPIGTFLTEAAS